MRRKVAIVSAEKTVKTDGDKALSHPDQPQLRFCKSGKGMLLGLGFPARLVTALSASQNDYWPIRAFAFIRTADSSSSVIRPLAFARRARQSKDLT